ncbi:MAG: hypothetical protein HUJ30_03990 [Gammaproteobacteria bacterium]|nr:hypothetical protein [Gammaproteobacteria bacterium]
MSSAIRNAYIDSSKMTASVVAVVTDVMRNGKPMIGFEAKEDLFAVMTPVGNGQPD